MKETSLNMIVGGFILNLEEKFSVTIEAVSPYSFELTLRKPAGWWWSTPDEDCNNNTCWSATRFNYELIGLRLRSIGTTMKPQIHCTIYSKSKMGISEKQLIRCMLKRALKTEEDLSDFYKLNKTDDILRGVVEDLLACAPWVGQNCFQR
jgi:hypothetical protein